MLLSIENTRGAKEEIISNKTTSKKVTAVDLRVLVMPDGGNWFAQGLEIDYAASGESREDVKRRFESGLAATVDEHLKIYGNIKGILKAAPGEIWDELYPSAWKETSQTERMPSAELPFQRISYLERALAGAGQAGAGA